MTNALENRAGTLRLRSVRPETILRDPTAVVVDLRAPKEFAEDHVPGASNVPLFGDVERALVGTLYRQASPEAAFEQGRVIARARIAALAGEIARLAGLEIGACDLESRVDAMTSRGIEGLASAIACEPADELPPRPIVLHCWRGGLRSRSVAGLLVGLGIERVVHLEGGYKAYRAEVVRTLAAWRAPRTFVLRGLTGVGKTLVLREIERVRPGWTIDLEDLARHRSSLLGMVGLEPRSQRGFESGLAARLRARADGERGRSPSPLVLEGESRKVGDVILPPAVWRALSGGTNLELTAGVERRIAVLRADYLATPRNVPEIARQLPSIEERMEPVSGEPTLSDLLAGGRIDELVERLLHRYYDPLYRHGEQGRRIAARFDATDPSSSASEIVAWIEGAGSFAEAG
jgi:tRNA 2-selenouridine synthase